MKIPKFADLIIFENDNVIVVNKPAFLSSLDDRVKGSDEKSGETNLIRLAKQYVPDAQICHRLDRETSGALIIAKNPETYRFISMQFEHRQVKKVYHAIIDGTHAFEELSVNLPILNLGNKNVSINKQDGKPSETIFNSIRYYKHYTLVECRPITGRMHQIRIHLATQHASIAGDDMYGGKPIYLSEIKRGYYLGKDQEELPIMKRFALHARELTLRIDEDTKMTFEAPYPKDFATLLKLLDRYDS
ncbi:MAG TPA: RNA pseudouridine synthase [Sphingobacteriaceae bacterium]|nr:RNA pseudouridine synthase [Sphingobacteriaceae bacterium]